MRNRKIAALLAAHVKPELGEEDYIQIVQFFAAQIRQDADVRGTNGTAEAEDFMRAALSFNRSPFEVTYNDGTSGVF